MLGTGDAAMLAYELLETQTGNLMSSHDSEAQALQAVVERVHRFAPESVYTVALVQVDDEDDDGEMTLVAAGVDLLARAGHSGPATPSPHNGREPARAPGVDHTPVRFGQGT